jgi:hypothetical protein
MTKTVFTLAGATALLLACAAAPAAAQEGAAGPEAKSTAPGAKPATEAGEAAKPGKTTPSAEAEETETAPEGEDAPVPLAELTRDGFEIHATDFIPAEARDAPYWQGLLRRRHRDLAEHHRGRGLLLYAEGLCG